jgi:hypothetical protein
MSGERTVVHRPAVKMAAAMMPPAEMVAVTMTTAAVAAATTTAVAAFRNRKVRHGQNHGEDNRGNSQRDL